MKTQFFAVAFIVGLFGECRPFAIIWFIVSVVVFSFYGMTACWFFSHVNQKILKPVFTTPPLTNCYFPASIFWMPGTPAVHCYPRRIFKWISNPCFIAPATIKALCAFASNKIAGRYQGFITAVTFAFPKSMLFFSVVNSDNQPVCETNSRQIFKIPGVTSHINLLYGATPKRTTFFCL